MRRLAGVLVALALSLAGCDFVTWHGIPNPGQSQVLKVKSGDRFFFSLDEDADCPWDFTCDDSDVLVLPTHVDGKVKVEMRIHRGYDGPSAVRFFCQKGGEPSPRREFTLSLYRITGDRAFWE